MNHSIPDFNHNELHLLHSTLKERYQQDVEIQLADSEIKLDLSTPVLTLCPTVFWQSEGTSFVIFKTAPERYRCLFFYSDEEHYGTGIHEYDNITTCVITLLQVQADHLLEKRHME